MWETMLSFVTKGIVQHLGNIATGREPDAMGWSKLDVKL